MVQNSKLSGETEEFHKLSNLLEVLRVIDLNYYWLLAVTSLAAQEVTVKKKLEELGLPYDEEDFQKLADKLIRSMKEKQLDPPEILLSISRSYRPIRAKIIHAPHKTKLSREEAVAIFYNTEALINTLFKREIQLDVSKFIQSIDKLPINEILKSFQVYDGETKKQIFDVILDRISLLSWNEIKANKFLFEFLKAALKTESVSSVKTELFSIILNRTFVTEHLGIREELLDIIAEFTKIGLIKIFIKEKGYIEQLIAGFEVSDSYAIAAANAEIILNLSPLFNSEQINRILDASLSNDQILYSVGANSRLKKFLTIHEKDIPQPKREKLLKAFE